MYVKLTKGTPFSHFAQGDSFYGGVKFGPKKRFSYTNLVDTFFRFEQEKNRKNSREKKKSEQEKKKDKRKKG